MKYSDVSRRDVLRAAAATAAAATLPLAHAQSAAASWPAKPVFMVVPFPPGGGTDAFARPFGAVFQQITGKQLVIDNKGGAGGTVGAAVASRQPNDGYYLFMGAVHHTIAPWMYKLDYDLERDFVPLTIMARVPQVLVVNPKRIPVNDFKGFLELMRKYPGKYNYGSAGSGTSHHLAGELFKQQTKTFITHIPYRGAGPALQDLISGNVDMMFDGLGSSSQHIKGGRIKALMISGTQRNPAFPDVPCSSEVGLPQYQVTTWYGLWAPKGIAPDMQQRIVEEVRKTVNTNELKQIWAQNGADFPDLTGAKFGQFIHEEVVRWGEVVKTSGAKLD